MKKFKKLIPALCMLLISAVLMGTSTYAWFSMNETVKVEGLNVTAKSEQTYLLISGTKDTATEIQADKLTTATFTIDETASKVAPSAHETITNTETTNTANNWYYKIAKQADSSEGKDEKTTLTTLEGYVIHKTVYITLAQGSVDQTKLTATVGITAKEGAATIISPVKVIITATDKYTEFATTDTTAKEVYSGAINDKTVVTLDIFIYYDGNDTAVFTNNYANLAAADIALSFTVGK